MWSELYIKAKIFAVFIGLSILSRTPAFAAYPINGYQAPAQYGQPAQVQQPIQYAQQIQYQQPQAAVPAQSGGQYIPVSQVARYPQAASPGRVTGSLPKVGSSYVNAGRKYYQPEGFDRLSDSGLYVGLSLGYTYSINGGMIAKYMNEDKAWFVPGAFQKAKFKHNSVLPLQISVGAALNNDVRVDFSYLRYSGISYPGTAQTSNGAGGFIDVTVTDGRVSSTATMLNLYYNLDSYTGVLASGSLRPYVGVGLGISINTISDYVVFDKNFYSADGVDENMTYPLGTVTGTSDIYAYHSGGTAEQLAYAVEGGVTTELDGGLKLDFFVRWAYLGKVESSGSIVLSQTEWVSNGSAPINQGGEQQAEYDAVFHYTNWKESGSLNALDMGVRMRIQF
ncbi:MAG: hypothetical protein LBT45_03510 [Rickettsiales bacterium]|jgi:hypothetical protein|nr:hypothetical protein [Rickettsiales bacterium]